MKINRPKPTDKKMFTCPQCEKYRMIRPLDHVVSTEKQEFKTKDGSMISLFTDTCEACFKRNYRQFFEPTKQDVKNILKSMTDASATSESLENLL
jgi:Holliday junction resolvase RusA-like endonuclease